MTLPFPARKLIRQAFRNGTFIGKRPARSPLLHATITERGEIAEQLSKYSNDGCIGIHWHGRQYCDSDGRAVSYKRVLATPTIRGFHDWLESTDPWIEGPCGYTLFRPSDLAAGAFHGAW